MFCAEQLRMKFEVRKGTTKWQWDRVVNMEFGLDLGKIEWNDTSICYQCINR